MDVHMTLLANTSFATIVADSYFHLNVCSFNPSTTSASLRLANLHGVTVVGRSTESVARSSNVPSIRSGESYCPVVFGGIPWPSGVPVLKNRQVWYVREAPSRSLTASRIHKGRPTVVALRVISRLYLGDTDTEQLIWDAERLISSSKLVISQKPRPQSDHVEFSTWSLMVGAETGVNWVFFQKAPRRDCDRQPEKLRWSKIFRHDSDQRNSGRWRYDEATIIPRSPVGFSHDSASVIETMSRVPSVIYSTTL